MNRRKKRRKGKLMFMLYFFLCIVVVLVGVFLSRFFFPHVVVAPAHIINPSDTGRKPAGFENALKKEGVAYESVTYASQSSTLVVTLDKDVYAYLDTSLSSANQVKLLSTILSRMTIENPHKKIKYIDLRYEKPVVKF